MCEVKYPAAAYKGSQTNNERYMQGISGNKRINFRITIDRQEYKRIGVESISGVEWM